MSRAKVDANATRERLIAAALDLFGRRGFEGTATRDLAARAGVNLAAIRYHFGGKEGLYRAVARHIAEAVAGMMGPAMAAAASGPGAGRLEPAEAARRLDGLVDGMVQLMVLSPQTESWARFMLREQMEPTPAFEIIYEGVMRHLHALVTRLVAAIAGLPDEDEEARLAAFAVVGQVLVFRIARAAVLRRMGWAGVGPAEAAAVRRAIGRVLAGLARGPG